MDDVSGSVPSLRGSLPSCVLAYVKGSPTLVCEPYHFMRGLSCVGRECQGAPEYAWSASAVFRGAPVTGLVPAVEWVIPIHQSGDWPMVSHGTAGLGSHSGAHSIPS